MNKFDEKENYSILISFYKNLLTEKQLEVITLYHNEDYSLQEIADIKGISKNAVYYLIVRTQSTLNEYEKKINLVNKFNKRVRIYKHLLELKDSNIDKMIKELIDIEEDKK